MVDLEDRIEMAPKVKTAPGSVVKRLRLESRRGQTRFSAVSGLAALLLLVGMSLSLCLGPAVLCIGSDGHRDVEVLAGGCCSSPASSPASAEAALKRTGQFERSCGACFDLLLETPRVFPWQPRSEAFEVQAASSTLAVRMPDDSRREGKAPTSDPARGCVFQPFELLSTVILLT